ncbi:MAG: hypothetical protein FWE22_07925 [Firmicutes bacterium]|nr:hypothetical protein [Bacillota bacterium]
MLTQKNLFRNVLVCTLVILLVFGALFSTGVFIAQTASAQTNPEPPPEFVTSRIAVANGDFSQYSGSFPSSPTGWSENVAPHRTRGASVAGVLNPETFNTEEVRRIARFYRYPELVATPVPQTPFGPGVGHFTNTTRPFLVINTDISDTAIRFDSNAIPLENNSFYRISAWVRTGNFASGSGASIRLGGLHGDYAFTNINTINALIPQGSDIPDLSADYGSISNINRFGWREYIFYVATSPIGEQLLTISLGVGDFFTNEYGNVITNTAQGYAFFDEVTAYEISATTFNFALGAMDENNFVNNYTMVVQKGLDTAFADVQLHDTDTVNGLPVIVSNEAADFGFQFQNWDNISVNTALGSPSFRNINEVFQSDAQTNLNFSAYSPLGRHRNLDRYDQHLQNFLMLNTFSPSLNRYQLGAIGVQSREALTIERFAYYRLSVWVKTQDVEQGSGASIRLLSDQIDFNRIDDDTIPSWDRYIFHTINNVTGDEANAARYHWREYAFYIQGSSFHDVEVQLEFWLGSRGAESRGIAMFNNIRFDRLTFSEFTNYSANGTMVSFDEMIHENSTGVENSAFMTAGDFDERLFPLPVAGWQFVTPATSGTLNLSSNERYVDNEEILHGMFPLERSFFNSLEEGFEDFPQIRVPQEMYRRNALVLANNNRGAIGYRSPVIHLDPFSAMRISVDMLVENVPLGDYGASLVLRHGSNVIGTIQNITETFGAFQDNIFEFIVEGAGVSDVTVEIWLGMQDRQSNQARLSRGVVYVNQIRVEPFEGNFALAQEHFLTLRGMNIPFRTRTYSFLTEDFTAFDSFDNSFVRFPYNWQVMPFGSVGANEENRDTRVMHGIFDSTRMAHNQVLIPNNFRNDRVNGQVVGSGNVLVLSHAVPSSSMLVLNNSFNMAPEHFYRVTASVMVDLPDEIERDSSGNVILDRHGNPSLREEIDFVGAGVQLTGLDIAFENIRSTRRVDHEDIFVNRGFPNTFKTFTFYVMVGDIERNPSIALTLGGDEPDVGQRNEDVRARGFVYLRHFQIEEINNAAFEEAQIALEDGDLDYRFNIVVDLSTHLAPDLDPDITPPGGGIHWMIIPSILFSVALLLALALVVVRKLGAYAASKRTVKVEDGVNLYDRRRLVEKTGKSDDGDKIAPIEADKVYGEFDDDMPTAPVPQQKERPRAAPVADKTTDGEIETTATEEEEFERDAYTDEFED